jgi:hypothetical protein
LGEFLIKCGNRFDKKIASNWPSASFNVNFTSGGLNPAFLNI